tara:strand:+ start:438 stop:593 length:156 start_codon:yes stop_codon:yes gene_type:complete
MGSAISFVLSYIMYKEWKEEKRLKFIEDRKLWIEKYKIFIEQELMEAEDKK